jgi:hypothetical protein
MAMTDDLLEPLARAITQSLADYPHALKLCARAVLAAIEAEGYVVVPRTTVEKAYGPLSAPPPDNRTSSHNAE